MQKKIESTLSIKNKLFQKSILEHINSFDWEAGSNAPYIVEFDPTTACNLACPDCISRELLNQGYFTRERIRELINEMIEAGVKAVVLIGGGEPLAHPEIGWVIRQLGVNDIKIGLTTNGLLIHKYLDEIAEFVDWVRVSVDASTPETFHKLRPSPSGKSAFNDVIDNMKLLAGRRKGKLGFSYMVYSEGMFDVTKDKDGRTVIPLQPAYSQDQTATKSFHNAYEIYDAAVIAKEIGCDYFEIKPMYDINHYLVLQKKELMREAEAQCAKAKLLESDTFKVLFASKLKDLFIGKTDIEAKGYHRCAVSQLRTLVTPSGVYVCPYFRGRDDKKIGNVMNQSFAEMWHGDLRKSVIEGLDPSVDCRMHCIRHESNMTLEKIITKTISPEIVEDYDRFI